MIKNIFRVLFSNIGTTAIGLISSLLFPRIMEVNEYASYQTYVLYLSYITILHLGLPTGMFIKYGGKVFSEIDKAKYKGEMRLLLIILSFFSIMVTVGGVITNKNILILVCISILTYDYVKSYLTLLQAWGDFKKYSLLNIVAPAAICFIAALIYFLSGSLSGASYIYVYMLVYIVLFLLLVLDLIAITKSEKAIGKIITKDNIDTIKLGLTICIGSYVGSLFHSVDKQYIKMFFEDVQFAMYSFAMSMQTIMTVLITSLSQPMYFQLAASGMSEKDYRSVKELLLVFGSLSSCAYYACSIMVKWFIPKYIDSIRVIAIFFAIFPAMAVINCLYINLYKSRKLTGKYVRSLVTMLIIAIVLDALVILLKLDYVYLAVATVVAYYIWLVLGSFDFPELTITIKDYLYFATYFITYFFIVNFNPLSDFWGCLIGLIVCVLIGLTFYQSSILRITKGILSKFTK